MIFKIFKIYKIPAHLIVTFIETGLNKKSTIRAVLAREWSVVGGSHVSERRRTSFCFVISECNIKTEATDIAKLPRFAQNRRLEQQWSFL